MRNYFSVLFLSAFYFFSTSIKAQVLHADSLPSLQFIPKIEIGFIQGIGLSFEIPVNQKSAFEIGAGLGSRYTIFQHEFENVWVLGNPAFYTQAKYKLYYNRQKRLDKGKSIVNNSGNYVGFRLKYISRELNPITTINGIDLYESHRVTLFDINWGLQRPMGNRFLFNLDLGVGCGYDWDSENGTIYPAGNIRFAYKLWK